MMLMTCHNLDSARTVLDLVAWGCSSNASFNRSSVRNYANSYCKSSNRGYGARKLVCRRLGIPRCRVSSTKTSGTLLNELAQGSPSGLDLKKESRSSISLTSLFEVVAEDLLTLNQNLQSIVRKLRTLPITTHFLEGLSKTQFPIFPTKLYQNQTHLSRPTLLFATLRGPRGFGPPPRKTKKPNKEDEDDEEEEEEEEEEPDEGVIPEVVTNRMISRMGFSVGIPLFIGLLFFPFFYYLKVGLKIDVPTWVPFIVSFFFFGSALLGVSYGIVSSSWDPMREGSLLGWNEAKKNWPVFWQSLRGRSEDK